MVWLFGHDVPWLAIIEVIGLHFPVRRDFVGAKLSVFCTLESFGVVCRAPGKTIIALITLAAIGLDPLLARIESCANPHQSGDRARDRFIPASFAASIGQWCERRYTFLGD
jgi:hypothetical protein